MANVLVVDDDYDMRPLLRLALTKLGHTATLAARGTEGLALAEAGDFDVIILDVMMPDIDGYEVTRRLRANPHTARVPILILTARAQSADLDSAIEAGADAYLAKPFEGESLNRQLKDLLSQSAARRTVEGTPGAQSAAGRVMVVAGLRGGVGATTVAVTLAGALLRQAGRRVCLVDLTTTGGHVSINLRLPATSTWANLPAASDPSTVAQYLLRHDSGLLVLAAPSQVVRQGPPAAVCRATLEALQIFFTDVIVDASQLDDATWAALGLAERVLVVVTPDVCAVHTGVGTLKLLESVRRPESQVEIVLNHVSPDHNLPAAAVERAFGRPADVVIPYDRQQALALTTGAPLIFAQPGAALPAAVGTYALKLKTPVA
jgi:DNA-binding response OmpR family regulator